MVTVDTTCSRLLETLEVADEAIITFPEGLPGSELTEFARIEDQRFWPISWLQPLVEYSVFASSSDESLGLSASCSS